jgi:hypothetical protein
MKERITCDFLEKTLKDYNLNFEVFNCGMHYRIEKKCDFWPSTSRYVFLRNHQSGHGLQEMINLLKKGFSNIEESGNRHLNAAQKFGEKPYVMNNEPKKLFVEIADTDIDDLEKEDLRRIIIYLSNKLMEAEKAIAKSAPF